jgi:dTDP-4-dehydrorhamnose reductase
MKILLYGAWGQLGWELQRAFACWGEVIAVAGRSSAAVLRIDFSDAQALAMQVRAFKPQLILNAAAYTNVDLAEQEHKQAFTVNAVGPDVLAQEAKQCGALLVHFSSDYVFDGSGEQYRDESAQPAPLNVYGHTKWMGEKAVIDSGCRHLILRTSWVYGRRGKNFPRSMLQAAMQQDALSVVCDQIGAPTSAEMLADAAAHAVRASLREPTLQGLYHVAAAGAVDWHAYAQYVFKGAAARGQTLRVPADRVQPILTADYRSAARRPLNSRLNTRKFRDAFDWHPPDWSWGVDRLLDEFFEKASCHENLKT